MGIVYNIANTVYGVNEIILDYYTKDKHLLPYCRLIDFKGSPTISFGTDDYGKTESIPINGDIFARIDFIFGFREEYLIPLVKPLFTEITEEEYYAQINYKLPF